MLPSHTPIADLTTLRSWHTGFQLLKLPGSFPNHRGLPPRLSAAALKLLYGAVTGITDGGLGSFNTDHDVVSLISNGTVDRQALYMFEYQGIHEMTIIGQKFTKLFFNMSDTSW